MNEIITNNAAQYAFRIVKKICSEVGPGLPGSLQENERADTIKKELESHLGFDNVATEEFTYAPGVFLSSYPICGLLILFAALLNISMGQITGVSPWLTSVSSLAFSIMVPLPFIFGFVLAFELFDPLFRKKKSINVIGTLHKPGTKNVKRLLIVSGHHDSAPENIWLRFLGYGFFILLGTANDSGPFSQAGLKAMTLLAFKIPQQMVAFYHQKWDNPDILTIEPLLNVLKLTFEWIRNGGE